MAKKNDTAAGKPKPSSGSSKKAIVKKDVSRDETATGPRVDEAAKKQQQKVLNIFRDTFNTVITSPEFATTLQSVKAALFDRDFPRAFGNDKNLSVYAARYSPTRALCYASVLCSIRDHLHAISSPSPAPDQPPSPPTTPDQPLTRTPTPPTLTVLSIGGGAAETVALAAFLIQLPPTSPLSGTITLLDSAPWGTVVSSLTSSLITPPPLSEYASAATKSANAPLIPPALFSATFTQQDVLALDEKTFPRILGDAPLLVTLLFTLNELFTSAGIGKTTRFLLSLTSVVPVGSLLLVVDSPGSYSETSLGKDAKRYPMQWLLDHIMLGTRDEPLAGRRWTKIESHDSVWFRLADSLDYPITLENMRYQMHLYQTETASTD